MTQKVLKVGTSAAVTIPKSIMEKLGIRVGDRVTVGVNEKTGAVAIRAANQLSADDKHVATLTARFIERYRKDLEVLADK